MTDRHLTRRVILAGAACGLAAPPLIGGARAATMLKVSTSFPNDPNFSTARIWYDMFVPKLKANTDGRVATSFFPDNQLGQEADVISQVRMGVVDMMLVGTPIWTNIVPECGVFDLGYLFQDYEHLKRVSQTPAADELRKALVRKAGAHFPYWGRNLGARNFLTKFAFRQPADLTGKKIRSLPNPIVTETVRLMGAAATPMAFGEIYTGLQAGVLDGLEHDAPTILASKFFETAKYFTLTRHIYNPFGAFLSDRTLQRMPADQRDGLLKAVKDATDEHYDKAQAVETGAIEQLQTRGVTVEDCDRSVFRDRVRPLWSEFAQKTPGARPLLDAAHQTEQS